ncbi:HIT-like domain-containing protein [Hyaloraphidium curvatum]|nr:HIT-like domain-containing protein [Hyaloraphidium curvatum]
MADSGGDENARKTLQVLKRFKFERVLGEDPRTKSVNILGTVSPADDSDPGAEGSQAVLCVEKLHFTESEIPVLATERLDSVTVRDSNDIYTWINASLTRGERTGKRRRTEAEPDGGPPPDAEPDVKVYLIHPATELHVKKYTAQPRVLVRETPELHRAVTLPYIRSIPAKRTAWVQNILDGTKEQESVVLSDPDPATGFVVVPDSKWDRRRADELYLQVLCRDPALGSLRDLRAAHLPLLRNIRRAVGRRAGELYEGVRPEHLRMFIHYQPSYYRFHVHVTHIRVSEGAGAAVGQAHLLEDVVANLEADGEHYAKRTMLFALGVDTDLYARFAGCGSTFLNGADAE